MWKGETTVRDRDTFLGSSGEAQTSGTYLRRSLH